MSTGRECLASKTARVESHLLHKSVSSGFPRNHAANKMDYVLVADLHQHLRRNSAHSITHTVENDPSVLVGRKACKKFPDPIEWNVGVSARNLTFVRNMNVD